MNITGQVIQSSNEGLAIAIDRPSCGQCKKAAGCGYGSPPGARGVISTKSELLAAKVGDLVTAHVPDGHVGRAAGLAYGLPLTLGFIGAFGSQFIANLINVKGDDILPLGFVAGVIAGFIVLKQMKFEPVQFHINTLSEQGALSEDKFVPTMTLVSRSYCHLCHEMQDALEAGADLPDFRLKVVDVDSSVPLSEKYDELVPVLLTDEGKEICHYHLDLTKVREYLERFE